MRSAARRYVADARSASKPQPSAQHRRRGERKGERGAREESARGDARRGGPEVVASNVTRRAFSFARASRDARVSARRAALAAAAAAPSSVARRNEIPAGARVAPRGIVPARAAASRSRVPAAPPSASLMAWPTRPDGRAKRPSPVEASVEASVEAFVAPPPPRPSSSPSSPSPSSSSSSSSLGAPRYAANRTFSSTPFRVFPTTALGLSAATNATSSSCGAWSEYATARSGGSEPAGPSEATPPPPLPFPEESHGASIEPPPPPIEAPPSEPPAAHPVGRIPATRRFDLEAKARRRSRVTRCLGTAKTRDVDAGDDVSAHAGGAPRWWRRTSPAARFRRVR